MKKTRLLLIDDDEQFLDMMHTILEIENFELATFTEAPDIVSLVSSERPDIVLLDYGLKKSNGGELCRQIRNSHELPNLPVILLSAYIEDMLPLDKIPFTLFIPKPFDLWEFITRLEELSFRNSMVANAN